jgi:hypothetical protein
MFVVHDCVEVKRDHSARTIQVRWRRFKARRSGACPPPPADGAQKGPPADEPAESTEQLADDPAEPADPSRDDATRAAMAPLLIATRMAAILDARRRQRLSAGPPAIRWLAASAIGIVLLALIAGTLAGPTSVPTQAIDGPFTDGDPGGDAALRSNALSSVAHRISERLLARAAYHVLLAFVTTIFTVAVLWPSAFAAVAGRQPADVTRGLTYVMATPIRSGTHAPFRILVTVARKKEMSMANNTGMRTNSTFLFHLSLSTAM